MKQRLVVATKNKKKLQEIKEILKDRDLKITSLADFSSPPRIIENGRTFKENAIKKALKITSFTKKLPLGEDYFFHTDKIETKIFLPGVC